MKSGAAGQPFEAWERRIFGYQVTALRTGPQPPESCIINEYRGSARRVRTIFEIVGAAIQKQSPAVGVKDAWASSAIIRASARKAR